MKKYFFIIIGGLIVFPLILDWGVIGNSFPSNIDNNSWVCFWGSYSGAVVALCGLYWQIKNEERKKEKNKKIGILKALKYFFKRSLKEDKNEPWSLFKFFKYEENNFRIEQFEKNIYEIPQSLITEGYKVIFELRNELADFIISLNERIINFNDISKYLFSKKEIFNKILNLIKEKCEKRIESLKISDKNTSEKGSEEIAEIKKILDLMNEKKKNIENLFSPTCIFDHNIKKENLRGVNENSPLKKIIEIDKEILQKTEENNLELSGQEIQFMKKYITYEDEIINGQENIFILLKDIRRICKELDKEISGE